MHELCVSQEHSRSADADAANTLVFASKDYAMQSVMCICIYCLRRILRVMCRFSNDSNICQNSYCECLKLNIYDWDRECMYVFVRAPRHRKYTCDSDKSRYTHKQKNSSLACLATERITTKEYKVAYILRPSLLGKWLCRLQYIYSYTWFSIC